MDDRHFFDNLAPTWDDNETLSTDEKVKHILSRIGIKHGDFVLDLGTGTGVLLPHIAKLIGEQGKITAVDYSQRMLDRAIKKFSHLSPTPEFMQLDFENETIPGEFDHIILYCVYPHLHQPVETLKWLSKVNLKDSGDIIIAFPSDARFINNIHKEKKSESDMLPNPEELSKFLNSNGLDSEVIADSAEEYIVKINQTVNSE